MSQQQAKRVTNSEQYSRIHNLRKDIDAVDAEIARLLEKRFSLCSEIGKLKREFDLSVEDPRREIVVLTRVAEATQDQQLRESVLNVYRVIMKESREIQT